MEKIQEKKEKIIFRNYHQKNGPYRCDIDFTDKMFISIISTWMCPCNDLDGKLKELKKEVRKQNYDWLCENYPNRFDPMRCMKEVRFVNQNMNEREGKPIFIEIETTNYVPIPGLSSQKIKELGDNYSDMICSILDNMDLDLFFDKKECKSVIDSNFSE